MAWKTQEAQKTYNKTVAGRLAMAKARAARAVRHQAWVSEIKLKSGCIDCGFNKWSEALDFDHRTRGDKAFTISGRLIYSKTVLAKEIAKCEVRCANCHRHKTFMERKGQ